jgi:hypothetical protein
VEASGTSKTSEYLYQSTSRLPFPEEIFYDYAEVPRLLAPVFAPKTRNVRVPGLILTGAQKVFFIPCNQVRRQYRISGYPHIGIIRYYKLFKDILPLYKDTVLLLLLLSSSSSLL